MASASKEDVRLDELDKIEMWDLARVLRPGITEEEFNQMWSDFQQKKREHERTKGLQ